MGYVAAVADRTLSKEYPGAHAETPPGPTKKPWVQIAKRVWTDTRADQVPLLAAGVAFFSFLSLFPAMVAAVMVYGLVADPHTVAEQAQQVTQALPRAAADLVTRQMQSLTAGPPHSLGWGLVVALALALFSASSGVSNLITAVNTAYDSQEARGFVARRLLALALTVAAVVFVVLAVALVAVEPAVLDNLVPSGPLRWSIEVARWVVLLVAVAVALAVVYRWAPDRDGPKTSWVSAGALVATVIWLLASLGFSLYVDTFGKYSKTYGALAGVAVLLLWLWITNVVVLLGAEINAEIEQQGRHDATGDATGDGAQAGTGDGTGILTFSRTSMHAADRDG
jgi:membrane protein